MAGILLSGPAGAGKSQLAKEIFDSNPDAVIADFQSLYAAMSGDVRGADGRYPMRRSALLPTVEYLRLALIRSAVARGFYVIATNSDGDPARRAKLLEALGEGATERIVDPGREVVTERLKENGVLSAECSKAISRWYLRVSLQ